MSGKPTALLTLTGVAAALWVGSVWYHVVADRPEVEALTLEETAEVEIEDASGFAGRFECRHGKMVLYSLDNVSDFTVTQGMRGWMWQLTTQDGVALFFEQSANNMCGVIPE